MQCKKRTDCDVDAEFTTPFLTHRCAYTVAIDKFRQCPKVKTTPAMNQPLAISNDEWKEIMQIPEVRESWGIKNETAEQFADMVYGVKFEFTSGSPGYVGDLYILQGDTLTGDAPFILLRRNGALALAY